MEVIHVAGRNAGKISLFALSTCGWCRKTKQLLAEMGVEYDYVDVDQVVGDRRREVIETVTRWNPDGSFPTLVINDDKCIVGFQEAAIRQALEG